MFITMRILGNNQLKHTLHIPSPPKKVLACDFSFCFFFPPLKIWQIMFETAANCVNFVRLGINKLFGTKLEWINGLKILFLMCFLFIYHYVMFRIWRLKFLPKLIQFLFWQKLSPYCIYRSVNLYWYVLSYMLEKCSLFFVIRWFFLWIGSP